MHALSFEECLKSFVFRGKKDVDPARVASLLGLSQPAVNAVGGPMAPQQVDPSKTAATSRFLMPLGQCAQQITTILEDLVPDEWYVDCFYEYL